MVELIAICGPTAVGKSDVAMKACLEFNGELVSIDSMQVYKSLDIGTAKPTKEEQKLVCHHLIDIYDPKEKCSVSDFSTLAHKEIKDILNKGKLPILCGGTGLYMDSVINKTEFIEHEENTKLRDSLYEKAKIEGPTSLHKMLEELDPQSASTIHENNIKRVIRAIEICLESGKTKVEVDKENIEKNKPYSHLIIGLDYKDRQKLYDRINQRVDIMMENGLLEEAKMAYDNGYLESGATAAGAIGYKEFIPYFENQKTLLECVDDLKQGSRNYAKRQLTWFRRNENVKWFFVDDYENKNTLLKDIFKYIKENIK